MVKHRWKGFFQPKDSSGKFEAGFDTISWETGLIEASPWQYRLDVPHDVKGLDQRFDGKLCGKIGEIMQETSGEYFHLGDHGQVIHELREAQAIQKDFGLYAHSNQPVHHMPWITKKAGCNCIADQYLRKLMRRFYTSSDEDKGKLLRRMVFGLME